MDARAIAAAEAERRRRIAQCQCGGLPVVSRVLRGTDGREMPYGAESAARASCACRELGADRMEIRITRVVVESGAAIAL